MEADQFQRPELIHGSYHQRRHHRGQLDRHRHQEPYWKGTYQAPTKAGDWKWTSQGDTETMAQSLLASQDATKDFAYSEADGVSWETTALGTTITVKTAKQ